MQQLEVTALRDFVATQSAAGGAEPLLLDVREPWEVELGRIHLAGSRSLAWPMNTVPDRLAELDPTQPIICICHHGVRSAQVGAFLERQGCEAVYNLTGGTDAWSRLVDPQLARY